VFSTVGRILAGESCAASTGASRTSRRFRQAEQGDPAPRGEDAHERPESGVSGTRRTLRSRGRRRTLNADAAPVSSFASHDPNSPRDHLFVGPLVLVLCFVVNWMTYGEWWVRWAAFASGSPGDLPFPRAQGGDRDGGLAASWLPRAEEGTLRSREEVHPPARVTVDRSRTPARSERAASLSACFRSHSTRFPRPPNAPDLLVYGAADNNADGPILEFGHGPRALDDDPGVELVLFIDRAILRRCEVARGGLRQVSTA
jgi:hypothetical protein